MSEYKVVPKKHYNYYGCGSTKYGVYVKESFLFISWWSLLITCDTVDDATTMIKDLLSINNLSKDNS